MQNHYLGTPIIISAPSGAGKTSLVKALIESVPNLIVSVSHTTRPPRAGEVDGVNYHFVSDPAFKELISKNAFIEYAQVFGHYYGTSTQSITEELKAGKDVIFEIDWQGAALLRKKLKEIVSIFILPPSYQSLEQRLRKRGKDTEEVIQKRLQLAKDEMSHYAEFDYLVVNDHFDQALANLQAIIRSIRLRCQRQKIALKNLIGNLI